MQRRAALLHRRHGTPLHQTLTKIIAHAGRWVYLESWPSRQFDWRCKSSGRSVVLLKLTSHSPKALQSKAPSFNYSSHFFVHGHFAKILLQFFIVTWLPCLQSKMWKILQYQCPEPFNMFAALRLHYDMETVTRTQEQNTNVFESITNHRSSSFFTHQ